MLTKLCRRALLCCPQCTNLKLVPRQVAAMQSTFQCWASVFGLLSLELIQNSFATRQKCYHVTLHSGVKSSGRTRVHRSKNVKFLFQGLKYFSSRFTNFHLFYQSLCVGHASDCCGLSQKRHKFLDTQPTEIDLLLPAQLSYRVVSCKHPPKASWR